MIYFSVTYDPNFYNNNNISLFKQIAVNADGQILALV